MRRNTQLERFAKEVPMRHSNTSSVKSVASRVLHAEALAGKAGQIRASEDGDGRSDAERQEDAESYLAAVGDLYRLVTPLLRAFSQGSITVLLYLDTHRHDTSAVRISEEVGLTRPRITQIVDSLEEMGLAKRVKDPSDARKIRVSVTRKGHKVVSGMRTDLLAIVKDFQTVLGEDDSRELTRLLRKVAALLHELDGDEGAEED